mmetsp:Transcript_57804/g.102648  ORF Transcript_57804/g.102648 Transcript_57804/m.102648 type:complete len:211 (+) Transcript_57804:1551-2183(+)
MAVMKLATFFGSEETVSIDGMKFMPSTTSTMNPILLLMACLTKVIVRTAEAFEASAYNRSRTATVTNYAKMHGSRASSCRALALPFSLAFEDTHHWRQDGFKPGSDQVLSQLGLRSLCFGRHKFQLQHQFVPRPLCSQTSTRNRKEVLEGTCAESTSVSLLVEVLCRAILHLGEDLRDALNHDLVRDVLFDEGTSDFTLKRYLQDCHGVD